MKNYELQSQLSVKGDFYNDLVGDGLTAQIIQDNMELTQSINEAKAAEECKNIMELYDKRIKIIENFIEKIQPIRFNFISVILMFYCKTKNYKEGRPHLGKWLLLNF